MYIYIVDYVQMIPNMVTVAVVCALHEDTVLFLKWYLSLNNHLE